MVAMRVTSLAAGLLLAVAACGGEKKAPEQTATADTGAAMAQTPSGPAGDGRPPAPRLT
jgi:hypothetical protein